MTTTRCATALALLAALAVLGPVPDALGRGNGDRRAALLRGGDGKKEKKLTADQKLLDAVAAEFKGEDYAALGARMPGGENGRITLRIGDAVGRYKRASAEGVLKEWFKKRAIVSVKRTSNDGLVGEFDLKFRRTGRDEEQERILTIGLRRSKTDDDKEVVTLVQIEVHGT